MNESIDNGRSQVGLCMFGVGDEGWQVNAYLSAQGVSWTKVIGIEMLQWAELSGLALKVQLVAILVIDFVFTLMRN